MRAWGGVGLELELEEAKDDTDGAVKIHRTEQCEWNADTDTDSSCIPYPYAIYDVYDRERI